MKLLYFAFLLPFALQAQPVQFVNVQPDCQVFINFTALNQTSPTSPNAGFDNRGSGCTFWAMSVAASGFSSVTVALQSAPNNNGAPGTYVTFAGGTITSASPHNVNPIVTGTQDYVWIYGYNPWVQVKLTAVTGSGIVNGALYGWRQPASGASGGGTTTGNVNVVQWGSNNVVTGGVNGSVGAGGLAADGAASAGNPVLIAGHDTAGTPLAHTVQVDTFGDLVLAGVSAAQSDGSSNTPTIPGLGTAGAPTPSTNRSFPFAFNGSTWDRQFLCTNQAAFNLSGSGDTQIIAASGSTVIRICHISFTTTAPEDIQIDRGTGVNCGTGTTALTGLYKQITGLALDFTPQAALRGTASNAVCLNQSAVQALGGVVIYAQY